ncbi:Alcohol dehydrogenase superfamily [Macleaya cordata]|uniref:Alcohol dehydrogenase superfamily n=1 Tax=Macleaya cordata TaxID=56857 RepID=A0A200PV33_MACCD|nr:Alcohol dehydrogenase superfamily [Macleaya cordata]
MFRKTGPEDVGLKVLYCGIDHTDLHQMKNEMHMTNYPLVPGHEVVGEVVELGSQVKKFKVGDLVGVECIIGSCGECSCCKSNMEQYCSGRILTYNGIYKDGKPTQGGFSSTMVVHQKYIMEQELKTVEYRFVVRIPEKLAPEQAAPRSWSCGCSDSQGHGTSCNCDQLFLKEKRGGLEAFGCRCIPMSSVAAEMAKASESLGYILDTIPAVHPLEAYISLLKFDGKLLLVGVSPKPLQFNSSDMILGRKSIGGGFIGSMEETQEILEFWAEKGLKSMIEVVKMDYVNKAFERMERNDVRYRFVLDVASSDLD